MSKFAVKWLPY